MKKVSIVMALVSAIILSLLLHGGGKPSRGTSRDQRLKENKPQPKPQPRPAPKGR